MVFPGCKANAGTVIPKGPRTDFAKKPLATQGCGRAVKFCLRPALNPRLLSSDASRTQKWKQHGGRRHSCFALETPPPVRFFDPDPEFGTYIIKHYQPQKSRTNPPRMVA